MFSSFPGLHSGSEPEDIVPVFARGTEPLDRRIECDHGKGHGFTSLIAVEAAVEQLRLATASRPES